VYFAQRQAGIVNFSKVKLSLPTVGAAAASGNSAPAKCIDTRKFNFRVHQNRKRVVRVRVYVNGKLKRTVRGRRVTKVRINKLPQGVFRVKIVAVTANGQRVTSVRTYRGCEKGRATTSVQPGR
jgi:hypothetical protein